jgi:hypothetical protein
MSKYIWFTKLKHLIYIYKRREYQISSAGPFFFSSKQTLTHGRLVKLRTLLLIVIFNGWLVLVLTKCTNAVNIKAWLSYYVMRAATEMD